MEHGRLLQKVGAFLDVLLIFNRHLGARNPEQNSAGVGTFSHKLVKAQGRRGIAAPLPI
jgi:hypothetical protein